MVWPRGHREGEDWASQNGGELHPCIPGGGTQQGTPLLQRLRAHASSSPWARGPHRPRAPSCTSTLSSLLRLQRSRKHPRTQGGEVSGSPARRAEAPQPSKSPHPSQRGSRPGRRHSPSTDNTQRPRPCLVFGVLQSPEQKRPPRRPHRCQRWQRGLLLDPCAPRRAGELLGMRVPASGNARCEKRDAGRSGAKMVPSGRRAAQSPRGTSRPLTFIPFLILTPEIRGSLARSPGPLAGIPNAAPGPAAPLSPAPAR